MIINYNLQKLNDSFIDFYNATGVNMALFKSDMTYVCENFTHWEKNEYCKAIQSTEKGCAACRKSDTLLLKKCIDTKQAQYNICSAGLVDVVIPVLYKDEIIGFILFGQMRPEIPFSEYEEYIASLGLDTQKMKEYHTDIPIFDFNKIKSISNIASMFTKYILLENLLTPNMGEQLENVLQYIEKNLDRSFSIQELSKNVNLSKSALYHMFHTNFNCTVNEYINKERIKRSLHYLLETDLTIDEISAKVGFSSVSYYTRIFKKIKNTTPLQYKKQFKTN